ncbi:MAG: hypothetical protein HPY54_02695 [Chthonomonadetes bacterium]|jgi:hypothetical protein|nr:hypothetical protein [Chthonomonadetes bacterium]
MHRSEQSAEVRWLRAQWARYYFLRRCYLWAARGIRTFVLWLRDGVSLVAQRILERTDPLTQYRRQREQFLAFYDRYEELVDLLCWAARDTVHDGCDEKYQRVREWLNLHYAPVRRAMAPFTRQVLAERAGNPQEDPFALLFAPAHVMQVIEQDQGDLLERIILTREIVARYDAHLRTQIDKHRGKGTY